MTLKSRESTLVMVSPRVDRIAQGSVEVVCSAMRGDGFPVFLCPVPKRRPKLMRRWRIPGIG